MTTQASRTYGGASEEERRSRRRAALLDATLDVVAAKGVKGLGVK
ncbi:MAG: TetR/AcrR family transcriptional regulator, partial [Mycobacterium sp.]|nr:TetR/AcrR family transcriptional regulator [Mycobacterium sp.]